MIFRNKALKTTAAAIAIISMVGAGTINYVHADSSLVSQGVAIERIVNNEYEGEVKGYFKTVFIRGRLSIARRD